MKRFMATLMVMVMLLTLVLSVPVFAEEGQEPITLTVFRGDPGDQPAEDNKIYKKIEEEFGVKFEFEFLAGDLDEKLGLMIAGEDYPRSEDVV